MSNFEVIKAKRISQGQYKEKKRYLIASDLNAILLNGTKLLELILQ